MGRLKVVRRLGHAVRRRRVAAGLSQEALARAARVHPTECATQELRTFGAYCSTLLIKAIELT